MVFSTQQAARLSGASIGRLNYWRATNVLAPSIVDEQSNGPFRLLYSFVDVVSLRTLVTLRDQHHIELEELRRAGQYLRANADHPWTTIAIRVAGKHIAFLDPETNEWTSASPLGQRIFEIDLENVRAQTEREARELMARRAEAAGKFSRQRNVMSNLLVFDGTRIPVEAVISLADAGLSTDAILKQFPTLTDVDIDAALKHHSPDRKTA